MRAIVPVHGTYPRVFAEWGLRISFIKSPDNVIHLSVREVCEQLGLEVNGQLARMRTDTELIPGVVDMRLPTETRGIQKSVCIRAREAAWWLSTIERGKIKKPEVAANLDLIREVLKDTAESLLFGSMTPAPTGERGIIAVHSSDRIILACPECGTRWRITITNGEAILDAERDD